MPHMYPNYITNGTCSNAERIVFQTISNCSKINEWVCFHSLNLTTHSRKAIAEADFVLLGQKGLFVLEVKGGRVSRRNGRWYFMDRFGNENSKSEGPFKQASGAMYALINALRQEFGVEISQLQFGYGVMFPDIEFALHSPEWSLDVVFDSRDRLSGFENYLSRLINYWHSKENNRRFLRDVEFQKYAKFLRGNFEFLVPMRTILTNIEENILLSTTEQQRSLDGLAENKRVLFKGAAGTGKTVLALEQAKRYASHNQKTLLLCFNTLLGGSLEHEVQNSEYAGLVVAGSIYSFFYATIKASPFAHSFQRAIAGIQEFPKEIYQEYFLRSHESAGVPQFDSIILDEAQDLLTKEILLILDELIHGGLSGGKWCIFCDSNNQAKLYNNLDPEALAYVESICDTKYILTTNCRNTSPISLHTSVMSGFDMAETRIKYGEPVVYRWYEDKSQLQAMLDKELMTLLSQKVPNHSITILYPGGSPLVPKIFSSLRTPALFSELTRSNLCCRRRKEITYSTIQSYKGLENSIIMLLGIEKLEDDWIRTLNYVGMSRAKAMLFVFLNNSLRPEYDKMVNMFLGKGKLS